MSADQPTREDLRKGMTVEIEQTNADDADPLVGDIVRFLSDEHTQPGGVKVELESGVTGRVKRVAPDK
ncbi:hypothetical protein DMJ13_08215 [halophilic archaeon]|nr:hypothetical protein DMJ13_08215 [halophilic archaeon]